MFILYRVRGASMTPTLKRGDLVLLRRRKTARHDDIVVVDHPRLGRIVKRIGVDGRLQGDGAESTDADSLGAYDPATLIGVAILAITPSGVRRLSARRSANRA